MANNDNKSENLIEEIDPNLQDFINELQKLNKIQVNNLETYKEKRIYSSLGHISEILCDWVITDEVDNN